LKARRSNGRRRAARAPAARRGSLFRISPDAWGSRLRKYRGGDENRVAPCKRYLRKDRLRNRRKKASCLLRKTICLLHRFHKRSYNLTRRVAERRPEPERPPARNKERLESLVELVDSYRISSYDTLSDSFRQLGYIYRGIEYLILQFLSRPESGPAQEEGTHKVARVAGENRYRALLYLLLSRISCFNKGSNPVDEGNYSHAGFTSDECCCCEW
jgi:hypothetical protein